MSVKKGDRCYFIHDGIISYGKISGIQNSVFFVQTVGRCGVVQLTEEKLYRTEEEAKKAMEKETPLVDFFVIWKQM